MKNKTSIKGFILIVSLLVSIGGQVKPIHAQEKTPAEEACSSLKPKYEEVNKTWVQAEKKNSKAYEETYQSAQKAYHNYIGCMFEFARDEVLKRNNKIVDWLAPKQACLDPGETKKIIDNTAPTLMIEAVLQSHTDYKNYLNELGKTYSNEGVETSDDGKNLGLAEQLIAKAAYFPSLQRQRQMEVDSSLVAIDLMFSSLKELRLAFVMHVHFQCSLKYLEKYRKSLGALRRLIVPLPDQLRDASVR